MKFTPEHLQGQFNSGLAIIYRLDNIHNRLYVAAETMNFEAWYRALISLFKEVSRSMNDKEKEQHQEWWRTVKSNYFEIRKQKRTSRDIDDALLIPFHQWELELNAIEQKYGMGMPTKKGGRFAISD